VFDGLVITTRQVMYDGCPILLVTHDNEEPKGWQFLHGSGDTDDVADGIAVHVEHLLDRHPSIVELADLPLGWRAWRDSEGAPWHRAVETDQGGRSSCSCGSK
jgi:hypothetical protein